MLPWLSLSTMAPALADIAGQLQRSRGAIGALLLRAMKKLRQWLEEPERDET